MAEKTENIGEERNREKAKNHEKLTREVMLRDIPEVFNGQVRS
jgi:hypothetical protein